MASGQARYKELSGLAAHADPDYIPNAHTHFPLSITPGLLQPEGAILALNEAAIPVAFMCIPVCKLIPMPERTRKSILISGLNRST